MSLAFDPHTTFPPPGRIRMPFEEAEAELVTSPRFEGSTTRQELWSGLERYLARFARLEEEHSELLGDQPLLRYLWMGGSFVSTKRDPDNIDISVFVDGDARGLLRGRRGAGWLTKAFSREQVKRAYGVSPIEVLYRSVPHVFRPDTLNQEERIYLQRRGAHDDWWQRCRPENRDAVQSPTHESAATRRGYLEVTL